MHFKYIAKFEFDSATWDLDAEFPDQIYKPDRGVFRLLKFKEDVPTQPDEQTAVKNL